MISTKPDSALKLYQRQLMQELKHKRTSLVAALLTILLHIMLLQASSIPNWHNMPVPRIEQVVQISLSPSTLLEDRQPALVSPPPELKAQQDQPKPRQPKISEPKLATNSEESQQIIPDAPANDLPPKPAEPPAQTLAVPEPEPEPSPAAPASYTLALPESVELKMALLRTDPDSTRAPIYGVGTIDWSIEGDRYKLSIEAGLDMLFTSINLYRLTSEGGINSFGLAPELSTEARRTRAKTATHFHPEDKTVSFSASSAKLAIQDGAQDKASFVMQLASIGKGDPSQFYAGREISLQVAEEKELSVFVFTILEKVELSTKLGTFSTWHLVRAPRPGAYSSQLEIWLAPATGWYPLQIRNTESNGIVTTQSVIKIIPKNTPDL
ncbi:DUF3108 domain-containing protein [Undibacterium parvum]|uniref:DUF3108 domain-containing protein n=1 Tax=Undibacterium parvum TaxID=401471 RepID=A0A3S9HKI7_9BURK|nr:DUF3108 domain-containing protein [Undibacterium parvum]AZP12627.1 DUF3108 domain-containing protein [Undibacterium parvum]